MRTDNYTDVPELSPQTRPPVNAVFMSAARPRHELLARVGSGLSGANGEPGAIDTASVVAARYRARDELHALYGDGKSRKGLIQQVEDLVEVADRGRWSVRIALWIGGGIVAAATAAAQLKTALTTFWGGH